MTSRCGRVRRAESIAVDGSRDQDVAVSRPEQDQTDPHGQDPAKQHFEAALEFEPLTAKRSWLRAAIPEAWGLAAPYLSTFVGPGHAKHQGELVIKWRESGDVLTTYPVTYDTEAANLKSYVDDKLETLTVAEFRKEFDPATWAHLEVAERADQALKEAAESHHQAEASAVWAEYYAHKRDQS